VTIRRKEPKIINKKTGYGGGERERETDRQRGRKAGWKRGIKSK